MLRPPLSRAKGLSTTAISTKSTTSLNSQCQPFLFGSKVAPSSAPLTLDECFTESPQQGFVPGSLASPIGAPRPKSASQKSSFFAQPTGSPSASHTRNPSAPYQRRRKAIRRSLSMVDKPADVFNQQPQEERDCGLHSIMDVDEAPQLALPHFMQDNDSIPRISKETMIEVLDGKFGDRFDHSMVVDCRFEYEYKGGHIDGAMNFNDKEELAHKLFQQTSPNKTLLIFHCEYSEFRAPMAAAYIRCQDRNANTHQYPKLTYPEVYILSGGYSSFFNDYKSRCYPQNYVEMKDKEHYNACERGLGRIKQQRNKLSRAQTFAFGQRSEPDDSPTAMGRQCTNVMARMDPMSLEQCVDASKRINARRQASF
ncbi:MAG: cell division cycle- protein [Stictis urceolatum]|nr:cell division cycle- protein [Stictis urceolata]